MAASRAKQIRALTQRIKRAGGEVEMTSSGHLKVTGPTGTALLGSDAANHDRGWQNTRATLRREAGIDLKGGPP